MWVGPVFGECVESEDYCGAFLVELGDGVDCGEGIVGHVRDLCGGDDFGFVGRAGVVVFWQEA
jgi:hypothetical protein